MVASRCLSSSSKVTNPWLVASPSPAVAIPAAATSAAAHELGQPSGIAVGRQDEHGQRRAHLAAGAAPARIWKAPVHVELLSVLVPGGAKADADRRRPGEAQRALDESSVIGGAQPADGGDHDQLLRGVGEIVARDATRAADRPSDRGNQRGLASGVGGDDRQRVALDGQLEAGEAAEVVDLEVLEVHGRIVASMH
jgi:hypothetical protein